MLTQDIDGLWDGRNDRGALENGHMSIGNKSDGAASLIRFAVQNNRSRNGNPDASAGHNGIDIVQFQCRNSVLARIFTYLSLIASSRLLELIIEAGGNDNRGSLGLGKELCDRVFDCLIIACLDNLR